MADVPHNAGELIDCDGGCTVTSVALYDGKLLSIARLKTCSSGSRNVSFDVTLLAAKAEENKNLSLCISLRSRTIIRISNMLTNLRLL